MTAAQHFAGGFADAPRDAAHAFRAAMRVMARPGTRETIAGAQPPAPLSTAAGTLLLTLCDPGTGVYLAGEAQRESVRDWIAFHAGAPLVGPDLADFALGTWDALHPLDRYRIGTPDYPDRSATLIVDIAAWRAPNAALSGPGIETTIDAWLPDPDRLAANAGLYPLGFDLFLTCGDTLAALPRSTRIAGMGG